MLEARSENGGPEISRNFEVGAFDRIELQGAYDTTVRTGSAPSVMPGATRRRSTIWKSRFATAKLVISHKKRRRL